MAKRTKKKPVVVTRKEMVRSAKARQQERRILVGVGVVVAMLLLVLGAGFYQENIGKNQAPIAIVNGVNLSTAAFQKQVRFQRFDIERRFGSFAGAQLDQYLRDQLPQQVFESMIENELLRQAAQQQGVEVSNQEIQEIIESDFGFLRKTPTPEPTPTVNSSATVTATAEPAPTPVPVTEDQFKQEYTQFLKELQAKTGMSEAEYREQLKLGALRRKMRDVISANVPPSGQQAHIAVIITDKEEDARKAKDRLAAGEDFAKVVAEVSTDTVTKEKGGDRGWIIPGQSDPAIDQVAFSLPVGQVSDPIETGGRWQLIKVLEREDNRPFTPDQLEEKRSEAFQEWLNQRKLESNIQRFYSQDKVPPMPTSARPVAPPVLPTPVAPAPGPTTGPTPESK